MTDSRFVLDVPGTFTTDGRSSVKVKINAKGKLTAEVKIYKGDSYDDIEKIYQLACEFIDRFKQRNK